MALLITDIAIDDPAWSKKRLGLERLSADVLNAVWKKIKGKSKAQPLVSITFPNDRAIRKHNKKFRGKDKATNVLSFQTWPDIASFPDKPKPLPVGDIFFAVETIEREARENGIAFRHHLTHLLIHGFLHVCGYDHLDEDGAERMEKLEISLLKSLGIKNPYADSDIFAIQ